MQLMPGPVMAEDEKRRIIVGVLLAMLLAALDQTIVAPAVPVIGKALGDPDYLPWIVSAYFLTATAVTPLYGKLADIIGRRQTLFLAIGIFVLGSIICAVAPTMLALVVGRGIQGMGGGGLMALAQTVIGDVVTPRERGKYTGYISTIWAISSVGGPVVGGVFAQHLHWSLIFWINLPLAAAAIAMANGPLRRLPVSNRKAQLDILGAVLIMSATVLFMLVLTWGGSRYPWGSSTIYELSGGALFLSLLFVLHQRRTREPLVPLSVLRNSIVATGTLSIFFSMAAYVGLSVYLPLYLQLVQGLYAASAGFALVPMVLATVVGANFAGRTMAKVVHYKRIAVYGGLTAIIGTLVLAALENSINLWQAEALLMVVGAGMGTQFPTITVSVQNAVDPRDLGIATAMLSFLRSLGSAIGLATLGGIILASGIVGNAAVHSSEGANVGAALSGTAARAAAEDVFQSVFLVAGLSLIIAFCLLLAMREKPLRGRAPEPQETAKAASGE
jgi:EmrB/QacA subfamily drug resistance transporter